MGNTIEPTLVIFPHFPFFMLQGLKSWQRALTLNHFARREKKNDETLRMIVPYLATHGSAQLVF